MVVSSTCVWWCTSSLRLILFPRKPGTMPPGSRHVKGGTRHDSTPIFLPVCFMLHIAWPSPCSATPQRPAEPLLPRRPRFSEPKSFAGLPHKPLCAACEQAPPAPLVTAPAAPPPRITSTRGRKRQVDTGHHFCPNPDCTYRGWVGWGNLRANGHPNSGSWR